MLSRVAFVTGAARGLGADIARALFEAGARVVLTDVDAAVEQVARGLDPSGERAVAWCLDVRDEAAFIAVFDAPSAIDGPQWRSVPAQRREALLATVPLGRAGRADEVSAAVLYLASDAAAYVNGITLDINGGRAMR